MRTKKVPLRKCVGCSEMKEKKQLVRVVRSPEGDISLDLTGPEAGAWRLCLRVSALPAGCPQSQKARTRIFLRDSSRGVRPYGGGIAEQWRIRP